MWRARVTLPRVASVLVLAVAVALVIRGLHQPSQLAPRNGAATAPAKLDTPTVVVLSGLQNTQAGLPAAGFYTSGTLGHITQPAPVAPTPGSVYTVGSYPLYPAQLADGPGKELVLGYCQTCHSVTYIVMQPPLPANTWASEVNKMIQTYGAVIPDDAAKQIIAYLQAHYTPETRK